MWKIIEIIRKTIDKRYRKLQYQSFFIYGRGHRDT